jgi:hypothetical protein
MRTFKFILILPALLSAASVARQLKFENTLLSFYSHLFSDRWARLENRQRKLDF